MECSSVGEEMDAVLVEFMRTLEELSELRKKYAAAVCEGYFNMAKARYSMGTHSVGSVQYDAVMTPLVHVQACLEHTRPSSYSELLPYDQRHERERECADVVTSDDGDGVMSDGDSGMGDGGKVDGDDGSTKPLPVWFCKRLEFSLERITPSMPQRVRGEGEGEGEEGEGGKSSSLRRRRTGSSLSPGAAREEGGGVEEVPMRQMGTRRRRRAHTTAGEHKGAGEGEGEGEGGGEEGVKEELPFIKDPLRWFGVLLPQNLPQAQKNFIEAISHVGKLAETQCRLECLRRRYLQLAASSKHRKKTTKSEH